MITDLISASRFGPGLVRPVLRLAGRCRRKAAMPVVLHEADGGLNWHLFGFSRQQHCLHLAIPRTALNRSSSTVIARVSAMATVLARCDAGVRGIAEFSDGAESGEGIVSLCGSHSGSLLIPENEFITSRGYSKVREMSQDAPAFETRRDIVLWRGSSTGANGAITSPGMTADTPGLLLRTRMCLLLRDVPGCDARIAGVAQSNNVLTDVRQLAAAGVLGHRVEPEGWLNVRYHIAIDGNTLAWSSTFIRLLMGCCLLKPESPGGYRLWYSDRFKPWLHYVPVEPDLSDLVSKIEWCRANVGDAARIAEAGRELAEGMRFEDEIARTVANINQAWHEGRMAGEATPAGQLLTTLP
ncbi:MAG: glycosyl transferase family 90 [Anderseniella sp.]|uniref:glycosyl transferase family 90 n=1 Tax=Parasphingorhabdus sp. TaxID=2709688 RepID=UPI003282B8A9